MTLRSGQLPFAAINYEQKLKNERMKRNTLRELNFTYRSTHDNKEQKHHKLNGLQICLSDCIKLIKEKCQGNCILKPYNGKQQTQSSQNWVVAIVGTHHQELARVEQQLIRAQQNPFINLVSQLINETQLGNHISFYCQCKY
ncbi:hypothetical protein FGO68_gene17523 [Halteria grandinella]|uniref:Uncharacterized protein n=1 Tax=Halteria grandinella TaxID=5974 RepID=A0A8J8P598_HALGN|nr:hypothetical protein FGO68_gene17523 [Halteria grandinella]